MNQNQQLNNAGTALDWDDEVNYTPSEFVLLPPGKYPFIVTGFDRQNFDGSARIPPCKMALLHLRVVGKEANTTVDERLYLHTSCMWKLSEFFLSIGQLKENESARMNWNAVPGSQGMLELTVNEYNGKDGQPRKNNRVAHFLAPDKATAASPAGGNAAPAWGR